MVVNVYNVNQCLIGTIVLQELTGRVVVSDGVSGLAKKILGDVDRSDKKAVKQALEVASNFSDENIEIVVF